MKVDLVDASLPFHPLLRHPRTGRALRAVGQRADGSLLWPLFGADNDGDEGEGGGDDDADDDGSDDDDDSEDDADESGESKGKSKKSKKSETVSREEFEALQEKYNRRAKHLSESDKKKSAAETRLAELERKDKSDLENAKTDLAKATKELDQYKGSFVKLARTNAFLTASAQEKINWHDPKVAQRAADLDDLEVDENGNVEGIREAVKALAKSHKFLVNSGDQDDDDDDGQQQKKRGSTGSGVGSTKTGKGKKTDGKLTPEELRARFPALR